MIGKLLIASALAFVLYRADGRTRIVDVLISVVTGGATVGLISIL